MVFTHPANAETDGTVLIHLQGIGRAQRRGLILIAQLLFGLVVELVVPAFRLSGLLPKLIGAAYDVALNWFVHLLSPEKPARCGRHLGASGIVKAPGNKNGMLAGTFQSRRADVTRSNSPGTIFLRVLFYDC
jgi:hypothetical protein